jgi:DNA-binding CsgD family transcriptional regulator
VPSLEQQARERRVGRPTGLVSRAKERELLRLLADGSTLKQAAAELHMNADTVLRLLGHDEFRHVVDALLRGVR